MVARCLTNAAMAFISAGEYAEGLKRVREARQAFALIGHDRAVGLTWSTEADALRRLGDLKGAHAALGQVTDTSARGYEVDYYTCAARLALDEGDREEATAQAQKAMRVQSPAGRRAIADTTHLAVEAFLAARDYPAAARTATSLHVLLDELAAFSTWQATAGTRLADEHAARAVRIMIDGHGSRSERLHAARDHLQMAMKLDQDFGWYHLDLAIVNLGDSQPRQAVRELIEAARRTDDPALRAGIDRMRAGIEAGMSATGGSS
jgi:tetratricopeptide (TPR) repeat protein